VLAPLGTALLGYREGDELEWMTPGGMRRLRIESVRSPDENIVRH
jgi:regulator of nucleoside diphosphate kinase